MFIVDTSSVDKLVVRIDYKSSEEVAIDMPSAGEELEARCTLDPSLLAGIEASWLQGSCLLAVESMELCFSLQVIAEYQWIKVDCKTKISP